MGCVSCAGVPWVGSHWRFGLKPLSLPPPSKTPIPAWCASSLCFNPVVVPLVSSQSSRYCLYSSGSVIRRIGDGGAGTGASVAIQASLRCPAAIMSLLTSSRKMRASKPECEIEYMHLGSPPKGVPEGFLSREVFISGKLPPEAVLDRTNHNNLLLLVGNYRFRNFGLLPQ